MKLSHKELQQYIIENLYILKTKRLRYSQFKLIPNNILEQITELTNYLDDTIELPQRLYHLHANLNNIPKCICNKEVKFYNFNNGYKSSCGNSSCTSKISSTKMLESRKSNITLNNTKETNSLSLEEVKEWIKDNLYRKTGTLDGNKLSKSKKYYNDNKIMFNTIEKYTDYLNNDNISESLYHINNNLKEAIICKAQDCNNKVNFISYNKEYTEYCSRECSSKSNKDKIAETRRNKTPEEREEIRAKIKKTLFENHGDENYTNKEKIKETYNNKTEEQVQEIAKKRLDTNIERYGVDNYFKSEEFKETQKDNFKERTLKRFYTQKTNYFNLCIEEYKELNLEIITTFEDYLNDKIEFKCQKCNDIIISDYIKRDGSYVKCKMCDPFIQQTVSKPEIEILKIVKEKDIRACNTRKIIKPFELDIYSEEFKFAIEYNGLMWHSIGKSNSSKFNNYKNESLIKNKHLNKTTMCEEQDIQLYHVFENEWKDLTKRNIWSSMIENKLNNNKRIFARKCIVKEAQNKESKEFLDLNHLQGNVNSSTKLGLYYNDKLVSLMTFGKSRYNKNIEYELFRFCNKINISVIGGASKLLKYFERNYKPKSIISYANRRWSNGNLYNKLGFDFIEDTKPNYFYFKDINDLESRVKYQKHKLKDILEDFNEDNTEAINMYNNNFRKIYDSGNKVYIKYYS